MGAVTAKNCLGKAMQGRRDKFIVATKIGWQGFDGEKGVSAYDTVDKLIAGVETNLKRLDTDYVDVIQSHIDFREPTMEVFIEGFQKLQATGQGAGVWRQHQQFRVFAGFQRGKSGFSTLQIDYSILNRTPRSEIFPYTIENDLGVLVRGPLAMGILTGKFSPDTTFERRRLPPTLD
jgi:aryl-alcohol dehydrogenase-like predicted oxidoreductase